MVNEGQARSIVCEDVCIDRGESRVIEDVSLRCNPGETVALLGANGAGKSTLIRAIGGTLIYTGHISVSGETVRPFEHSRVSVGHVSQPPFLDTGLDVKTMLTYHGRYWGLPKANAIARADELIEQLSLGSIASQAVGLLSGGQKQRAAVARSLVHDPEVLLLDEPFTGIDIVGQTVFAQAVFSNGDRTSLVVTHDAQWVEDLGVRAIVLAGGKIVADGRADQLVTEFCPTAGLLIKTKSMVETMAIITKSGRASDPMVVLDQETLLYQADDYSSLASELLADPANSIEEISVAQPSLKLALRMMMLDREESAV